MLRFVRTPASFTCSSRGCRALVAVRAKPAADVRSVDNPASSWVKAKQRSIEIDLVPQGTSTVIATQQGKTWRTWLSIPFSAHAIFACRCWLRTKYPLRHGVTQSRINLIERLGFRLKERTTEGCTREDAWHSLFKNRYQVLYCSNT